MRALQRITMSSSGVLLAVGVIHVASTPYFFGPPSASAAWFAGSGLALIFGGILNIALYRNPPSDRFTSLAQHTANGLLVWLGGFVVSQMPGIVSFVVLGAAIVQGLGTFASRRWRMQPAN